MKLNNKGFAFSTLLYGILAVITLLLIIIFATYRSSYDETFYYSAVMEESLNKCVDQELELENCYRTGSATCNKSAYYSCLGYTDVNLTSKKELLKDKLLTLVGAANSNFYEVNNHSLKYVYKGTNPNNYVKYSGSLWRIVGLTELGQVKITAIPTGTTYAWDKENSTEWSSSTLRNFLTVTYYNTITNTMGFYKYDWNVGRFDTTEVNRIKKSELKAFETASKKDDKVGLLSPSDIVYSVEANCDDNTNAFENDLCGNTWITETWLINSSKSSQGKAFYFDKSTSTIKADNPNALHRILPTIYLDNGVEILKDIGSGEMGSPYIIEG